MTIDGLQVDVPSAELKELLKARLTYHQHKVDAAQKQLVELERIDRALAEEAEGQGKFTNASMSDSIRQVLEKHKKQVVYYSFMATHVVPDESYRLTVDDLVKLGVKEHIYD